MKKTMMSIMIILAAVLAGCGTKKTHDRVDSKSSVPMVIISQDTYDSDNFSLISAAISMHKRGIIKLLAIDVTGIDAGDKSGMLFSVLLEGIDIPILINHGHVVSRVTPSSLPYKRLNEFESDGLLDSQRPDSTITLSSMLNSLGDGEKVKYVVGGHLTNIASLMKYDIDAVSEHISDIVISTGWTDRVSGIPEMNLSGGLWHPSGISRDTKYVFDHLPMATNIVIASDPDAPYLSFDVSRIVHNKPLYYLITNGHYFNGETVGTGDFEALLYAAVGTEYDAKQIARVVQTCFGVNDNGAIYTTTKQCNNYYLDDVDPYLSRDILMSMIAIGVE